jgi:hypothetical protein
MSEWTFIVCAGRSNVAEGAASTPTGPLGIGGWAAGSYKPRTRDGLSGAGAAGASNNWAAQGEVALDSAIASGAQTAAQRLFVRTM